MQENQMQYPLDLLLQTRMVLLQINLKAKASGEKILFSWLTRNPTVTFFVLETKRLLLIICGEDHIFQLVGFIQKIQQVNSLASTEEPMQIKASMLPALVISCCIFEFYSSQAFKMTFKALYLACYVAAFFIIMLHQHHRKLGSLTIFENLNSFRPVKAICMIRTDQKERNEIQQ